MRPWLETLVGNPASAHAEGRAARAAVDEAKAGIAALVGAAPGQVILTSGATEASNLAEAVHAYYGQEGCVPDVLELRRLLPGLPPVDELIPRGLATLCVWLGLSAPIGGCHPYAG